MLANEEKFLLRNPNLLSKSTDPEIHTHGCIDGFVDFEVDAEDDRATVIMGNWYEFKHPKMLNSSLVQRGNSRTGDLELYGFGYLSNALELEPVLDQTAPSAGIYDLNEPLFGLDS